MKIVPALCQKNFLNKQPVQCSFDGKISLEYRTFQRKNPSRICILKPPMTWHSEISFQYFRLAIYSTNCTDPIRKWARPQNLKIYFPPVLDPIKKQRLLSMSRTKETEKKENTIENAPPFFFGQCCYRGTLTVRFSFLERSLYIFRPFRRFFSPEEGGGIKACISPPYGPSPPPFLHRKKGTARPPFSSFPPPSSYYTHHSVTAGAVLNFPLTCCRKERGKGIRECKKDEEAN